MKGRLEILKEGEGLASFDEEGFHYEKHSIEGAEFDLYYEDILFGHYVTDAQGCITVEDLELGIYKLVETKAPHGMELDETPMEIRLEYKDRNTPVIVEGKNIYNVRKKVAVSVNKYKSNTEEKLTGGEFELHNKNDIVNYKGEVIVAADTVLATAEAEEGVIDFGLDLPEGDYYIVESKAVDGYLKNAEATEFTATVDEECEVKLYNEVIPPRANENHEHGQEQELPTAVKGAFVNYITEDFGGTDRSVLIGGIADEAAGGVAGTKPAGEPDISVLAEKTVISFLTGAILTAIVLLVLDIRKRREDKKPRSHSQSTNEVILNNRR